MATNTYVALDTKTITGSAAASVTFTSIPQTYTDLILVVAGTATGNAPYFQVGNGSVDTGSNYSTTSLYGNGSTAGSSRTTSATVGYLGGFVTGIGTSQANIIAHFQNYSNTTTNKTVLSRLSAQQYQAESTVSLWRSTSAINTIKVGVSSDLWSVGSTFTLYGIANSNIGAPKAFGGTITQDATYTYHTFGASGTFIPQQSLTADVLVVAGGGGGGVAAGGGGGAGGVLGFASQSLTATSYTVTVGAGGTGSGTPTSGGNSQFGSLTASVGGGRGSYYVGPSNTPALTGGSGGGGGYDSPTGAAGTSGQGFAGGNGSGPSNYGCGGGGGAGAVGGSTSTSAGANGGAGVNTYTNATWLATGLSVTGMGVGGYIAGGGGGGSQNPNTTQSSGGLGGGGAGGTINILTAPSAVANTGSGGGGAASGIGGCVGGNGGSGLVIIRYAN